MHLCTHLCLDFVETTFVSKSIFHRTLVNSMRSWKQSGLLDMVNEKIIILNDPIPEEYAIALEFGFKVIEPKNVPNGKVSL